MLRDMHVSMWLISKHFHVATCRECDKGCDMGRDTVLATLFPLSGSEASPHMPCSADSIITMCGSNTASLCTQGSRPKLLPKWLGANLSAKTEAGRRKTAWLNTVVADRAELNPPSAIF